MEPNAIARITLNPGRVGWFDPMTNIHLTLSAPETFVTKNMNTKNIQKAVNAKIIRVLWGSLAPTPAHTVNAAPQKQETVKEHAIEKTAVVQEVVEEVAKEESAETAKETPVASESKRASRRKNNKDGE